MSHITSRKLILGSTSSYRRELLSRLRLPFEIVSPQVDETPQSGESPRDLACRLALAKAHAVAEKFPSAVVIGSDQVADLDGQPLGKPGDHERGELLELPGWLGTLADERHALGPRDALPLVLLVHEDGVRGVTQVIAVRFDDMDPDVNFAAVAWDRELLLKEFDKEALLTFANQWQDGPQELFIDPFHGADIYKIHVKSKKIIRLTEQTWTPNSGVANWSKD